MTDQNTGSGSGDDEESSSSGPHHTFPEFIDYARRRRAQGPRLATDPKGTSGVETRTPAGAEPKGRSGPAARPRSGVDSGPASWLTPKSAVLYGFCFVLVCFLGATLRAILSGDTRFNQPRRNAPSPRLSQWIPLPHPESPGKVPEAWGKVQLGGKRSDLDPELLRPYAGTDRWADALYTPDPVNPKVILGLSFHHDRIYRIALWLGEDSSIRAETYAQYGTMAYGPVTGYEYSSSGWPHVVMCFQTHAHRLKLDSIRKEKALLLWEVSLVDVEQNVARDQEHYHLAPRASR